MEIHAPHEGIRSWRDFFVHLATITVGLLIALSLEAAVEWFHHRHLVHEALEKTYVEIRNNRKLLATDLTEIRQDITRTQADLKTLVSLRSGENVEHTSLEYHVDWSSFDDAAWRTAETSGAVNYMDYQTAQDLADLYGQQRILSNRGLKVFEDQSLAIAPIFITGDPKTMSLARHRRPRGATPVRLPDLGRRRPSIRCHVRVWQARIAPRKSPTPWRPGLLEAGHPSAPARAVLGV